MKKHMLFLTMILSVVLSGAMAQTSTLIINEDFQDWQPTTDTDPTDCEAGLEHEPENTRQLVLNLDGGTVDLDVSLIKCGVSPNCDTKRAERSGTPSTEGVTVGYISLSKAAEETDTIGQFIFGPVHHIDSIRFGHSATGDNRGIRIYKSADGETWERATEDEFYDSDDSQAGDIQTVVIDQYDVYIMFTSGLKKSDGSSQHSRLHNLEVWGIPGEMPSSVESNRGVDFDMIPLGDGMYSINVEINAIMVFNTAGLMLLSEDMKNRNTLNLSVLPNGIYILMATDHQGNRYSRKILKN